MNQSEWGSSHGNPSKRWCLLNDIDHTMIDSTCCSEYSLAALASALNISLNTVVELRDTYITSLGPRGGVRFHPQGLIKYLVEQLFPGEPSQKKRPSVWLLLESYLKEAHFQNSLYPEVPSVLQDLEKTMILGTFSEGVFAWQMYKLCCTNLWPFFSSNEKYVHILSNKRTEQVIMRLPERAIIPDDNLLVIALLWAAQQNGKDIHPIWVQRKHLRNSRLPDECEGVPTISTYEQLPDVIVEIQKSAQ
jgi:hypothetical protein